MDILLLALTSIFFLRGFFKGFLSTVFSLVGVSVVAFLSWKFCGVAGEMFSNWFNFSANFEGLINSKISGTFSSVEELQAALAQAGIFYTFLSKLLGDLSFEGNLSAGEVLAPKISVLLNKIIAFVVLFVLMCVVLKILQFLLNKFVLGFGLGFLNRTLGGVLGIVEGVLIAMLLFFILSSVAHLSLNEGLLKFVENGIVSNWIYENIITKSINLLF